MLIQIFSRNIKGNSMMLKSHTFARENSEFSIIKRITFDIWTQTLSDHVKSDILKKKKKNFFL